MQISDSRLVRFRATWGELVSVREQLGQYESMFSQLQGKQHTDRSLKQIRAMMRELNARETRLYKKARRQLFAAWLLEQSHGPVA
jgi:hypothetical protein